MRDLLIQPADWTEPGAHPVVDGVYRIPLPLPLDGLAAVNAYAVETHEGLVLIDPGWAGPDNERAISAALRGIGNRLDDVVLCLATHHHWDHYTQAYSWQRDRGIKLFTGRDERFSIESYERRGPRFPNHVTLLYRCGAEWLAERVAAEELAPGETSVPFGLPRGWLDDSNRVPARSRELEVVATPGHTRGHVAYRHAPAGLLFSGDHVLPAITPSIGFERSPEPRPLQSYLASLKLLRNQQDAVLLPAHGPVAPSVHARIEELLDHHGHRLREVRDLVAAGATTAYEVAARLPWTRHRRQLDHLPTDHQLSAIMEIDAHLDVLAMLGRLTVTDTPERRRFSAA